MRTSKIIKADTYNLAIKKGIGFRSRTFDGLATLFVKETGYQIEPAEEFNKPLVH